MVFLLDRSAVLGCKLFFGLFISLCVLTFSFLSAESGQAVCKLFAVHESLTSVLEKASAGGEFWTVVVLGKKVLPGSSLYTRLVVSKYCCRCGVIIPLL